MLLAKPQRDSLTPPNGRLLDRVSRCRVLGGIVVLLVGGLYAGEGRSETWHVPGDAPTIQAGINLASPGDDVLVAPGVYLEHDIALKGGVWVHSEQGPASTIVDAESLSRVFDCLDQEETVILEGFEIRGGLSSGQTQPERSGGGIRCRNTTIIIRQCWITGCVSTWDGGGIAAWDSHVSVESCLVADCVANGTGGGMYLWCFPGSIQVLDSHITRNSGEFMCGGMSLAAATVEVLRCTVSWNSAGWASTGGVGLGWATFTMRDCLITYNWSGVAAAGGAISIGRCSGVIDNCTIANNFAGVGGEAILIDDSDVHVVRSVLAFTPDGPAVECEDSQVEWECCDLFGNESDAICGDDLGGNFSADPLFCDAADGDYRLDGSSPCLPGQHPDGVDCGLIGALGWGCGAPPPIGACCLADGSCVLTGFDECESQQGTYQGDGTTCDPNPCVPTPTERTTWGRIRAEYR